ncbi:MAG: winged helix-turn-helix domain-containing protein [Actinomycetota bacterium]
MTAAVRTLTRAHARRAAVTAQLLAAPRPAGVVEAIRRLWMLQMDPTSSVARTEHLVLFSRLGPRYRPAELERLLWEEGSLFEYRAFILPTSDLPIHRETMRRYPPPTGATRHEYVRHYLTENAAFRRHILRRLRADGPLRTRDFDNHTKVEWRTGGWNDGDGSVAMMLEILWARGEVMIVGRDGQQRVWDLASRRLPMDAPRLRPGELAHEVVRRQHAAAGIAKRSTLGFLFDGTKAPGWERALERLVREGVAVPVTIEGVRGEWFVDAAALGAPFRPRTVLLSPFDRLIHDRARTEAVFEFEYRLEIYVPPAKRRYGYFVLPILHGDRLIGRLDPKFDRATQTLAVRAVWAEPGAPASAGSAVRRAIDELARWRGARTTTIGEAPEVWRGALRG